MQMATEMFREHTRSVIEKNITEALSILKSRSKVVYVFLRYFLIYYIFSLDLGEIPFFLLVLFYLYRTGMPQVIEELEKVLAFNDLLTELSKHPEASQFAPGVGPVSLIGTLECESSITCLMICNLYSHLRT